MDQLQDKEAHGSANAVDDKNQMLADETHSQLAQSLIPFVFFEIHQSHKPMSTVKI
jgi:hypothetical protein